MSSTELSMVNVKWNLNTRSKISVMSLFGWMYRSVSCECSVFWLLWDLIFFFATAEEKQIHFETSCATLNCTSLVFLSSVFFTNVRFLDPQNNFLSSCKKENKSFTLTVCSRHFCFSSSYTKNNEPIWMPIFYTQCAALLPRWWTACKL